MFWDFEIAFYLTLVLSFVVFCWRFRKRGTGKAISSTLLLFIPLCLLSYIVVTLVIYREYHFASTQDVFFEQIRVNIPPDATDIYIDLLSGAYIAKFSITEQQVENWFNTRITRFKHKDLVFTSKKELANKREFAHLFNGYGWVTSENIVYFEGPILSNVSGSRLLFDRDSNIAYQFYGFW